MPRIQKIAAAVLLLGPAAAFSEGIDLTGSGKHQTHMGGSVTATMGGGYAAGAGTYYTPKGMFEAEIIGGYDVAPAWRAELALVLGLSPNAYFGLRPGARYAVPQTPFYARAALDVSAPQSYMMLRWLLLGGGYEMRLTDALGGFAEANLGLPFDRNIGMPLELRVGAVFRF